MLWERWWYRGKYGIFYQNGYQKDNFMSDGDNCRSCGKKIHSLKKPEKKVASLQSLLKLIGLLKMSLNRTLGYISLQTRRKNDSYVSPAFGPFQIMKITQSQQWSLGEAEENITGAYLPSQKAMKSCVNPQESLIKW